jgi:hypothetical protein
MAGFAHPLENGSWPATGLEYDQAWNLIMNQFKDYMIGAPKMTFVDMTIERLDNA